MLAYLIVLVVLAAAIYLISSPLRTARRETAAERRAGELTELEAARDAKYREIRDAELDLHTGKLSPEDYQAIDRTLRAEAIEILHRLDEAEAESSPSERIPSVP
jgi:type II secretory pathway component PulM